MLVASNLEIDYTIRDTACNVYKSLWGLQPLSGSGALHFLSSVRVIVQPRGKR